MILILKITLQTGHQCNYFTNPDGVLFYCECDATIHFDEELLGKGNNSPGLDANLYTYTVLVTNKTSLNLLIKFKVNNWIHYSFISVCWTKKGIWKRNLNFISWNWKVTFELLLYNSMNIWHNNLTELTEPFYLISSYFFLNNIISTQLLLNVVFLFYHFLVITVK